MVNGERWRGTKPPQGSTVNTSAGAKTGGTNRRQRAVVSLLPGLWAGVPARDGEHDDGGAGGGVGDHQERGETWKAKGI